MPRHKLNVELHDRGQSVPLTQRFVAFRRVQRRTCTGFMCEWTVEATGCSRAEAEQAVEQLARKF